MNKKGLTPDELFLIKLYQIANTRGDPHCPVDTAQVAKAICYKETAVKNIVNMLAQTNFIKKISSASVSLTPHGQKFVMNELQ